MPVRTFVIRHGDGARSQEAMAHGSNDWADIVSDATADSTTNERGIRVNTSKAGANFFVMRGLFYFPLSGAAIPRRAQLVGADIQLFCSYKNVSNHGSAATASCFLWRPESEEAFASGDYNNFVTRFKSANVPITGANGYHTFPISGSFLRYIERRLHRGENLNFMVRGGQDYNGTAPTGVNRMDFESPDTTESDEEPKLVLRFRTNYSKTYGGRRGKGFRTKHISAGSQGGFDGGE